MKKNSKALVKIEEGNETILTLLHDILNQHEEKEISFGDIVDKLKDKGLALLLAILSFPIALPIPTPPGFTTIFGIPLCILTIQLIYRLEQPWLPKWLRNKKIKIDTFRSFVTKSEPLFKKLAKFLKPRYSGVLTESSERVIGILAFLCSVSIALPILFGNAIPSAAIFIMSLGIMYKDGLTAIIGMVTAVIGLIISTTVVILVALVGMAALTKITSFF
jgi:hypothetical protein